MKRIILPRALVAFLTTAVALAPSGLRAQGRPYVDPLLRRASRPGAMGRFLVPAPPTGPDSTFADRLLLTQPERTGEPYVGVFARLGAGGVGALRQHGALIVSQVRDWVAARVPVSALPDLLQDGGLRALYAAPTAVPVNDSATADIGAAEVRARAGSDFTGFTGHGVVIGLIDTGLDLGHEDFIDAATGQSRVARLWDQTRSGMPPAGFGFGDECTGEQIRDGSCGEQDIDGHGTHVMGSAGGSGRATGNGRPAYQYTGVAPEATLVVVKTNFSFDGIVAAMDYIFQVAADLGLPAVVNMSLGSDFGPHDGTRPWEQMIDGLVGPGRIAVASAGNAGANPVAIGVTPQHIHAMGTVAVGDTVEHDVTVINGQMATDLWYAGADTLAFILEGPTGSSFSAQTGDGTVSGTIADGNVTIDAPGATDPENGDHEAVLQVQGATNGTWRLRVAGVKVGSAEPYHAWLVSASSFETNFSNAYLVGTPATGTRTIAVAAYTTRQTWASIDGSRYSFTGSTPVGEITEFSAPGPRRDGVLKPEVAGPGSAVVSSLSSAISPAPPQALIVPDGVHWILQGTSMSSPMATGTIALFLEADPTLTPEDVRNVFAATARADAFSNVSYADDAGTVGTPNHSWGYGKLDVPAGLRQVIGTNVTLAAAAAGTAPPARIPHRATGVTMVEFTLRAASDFVEVTNLTLEPRGTLDFGADLTKLTVEPFGAPLTPDGAGGFQLAQAFSVHANSTTTLRIVADFGSAGNFGDSGRLDLTALSGQGGLSGMAVSAAGLPVNGWTRQLSRGITTVTLQELPSPGRVRGGEVVALARLSAVTQPIEPLLIDRLAVTTAVTDPELRLFVTDTTGGDTVYVSAPFASSAAGTAFRDSMLDIPLPIVSDTPTVYDIGYRLSPAAAHGSAVGLDLSVDSLDILGAVSGDSAVVNTGSPALAASVGPINLLPPGQRFGLSSNPIRGRRVVFTFGIRPDAVSVFDFVGERVRRFSSGEIEGTADGPARIVWDPIDNDRGSRLANGVYLLVIEYPDGRVNRQRLMILRGAP